MAGISQAERIDSRRIAGTAAETPSPTPTQFLKDFLKAIATCGKPVADIEQGHISTASCILANLSMKLGRSLRWDAAKQQIVNDDEANKLLRRPYRTPWTHPEV